jgi:hypothetical protein
MEFTHRKKFIMMMRNLDSSLGLSTLLQHLPPPSSCTLISPHYKIMVSRLVTES